MSQLLWFTCIYSVDATDENNSSIGRLINHWRKVANLTTKVVVVEEQPRLCFFAARDILEDEELFYDYGEKNSSIILDNPWLAEWLCNFVRNFSFSEHFWIISLNTRTLTLIVEAYTVENGWAGSYIVQKSKPFISLLSWVQPDNTLLCGRE